MPRTSLNPFKGVRLTTEYALPLEPASAKLVSRYNRHKHENPVQFVYSKTSRVIRGTGNMLAVKLKSGRKGWITPDGRFIDRDEFRELLHNVDQSLPAQITDVSLLDAFDSMTPAEQAEFADKLKDFDWNQFWEEIGSDDPEGDLGTATDAYFRLIDIVAEVLGWDSDAALQ